MEVRVRDIYGSSELRIFVIANLNHNSWPTVGFLKSNCFIIEIFHLI